MKKWLRKLLGLDADRASLIDHIWRCEYETLENQKKLEQIERSIGAIGPGMGRIIAKLDPMYGKSEDDPARKAESDRLGQEAIRRLKAEDWARRHTTGEAD